MDTKVRIRNENIGTVIRPNEYSPSKQLNELGPWVVAQIGKASKLAFFNINRNRRLGLQDRVASCKATMQK